MMYRDESVPDKPLEDPGLPLPRTASANQNIRNNIPRDKHEEWPPRLSHKLKRSSRAKDW